MVPKKLSIAQPSQDAILILRTQQQLVKLDPSLNVVLMGEPVERVYEARNLGLLMDRHLRFEKHIANIVKIAFIY